MGFKEGNQFWKNRRKWTGVGGIDQLGYHRTAHNMKRTRTHRLVMAKHLGRDLLASEDIHLIKSIGGVKCPNHGCPLTELGFPPKAKGLGVCPVSGAKFEYEMEIDKEGAEKTYQLDKNGNKVAQKTYVIEGED